MESWIGVITNAGNSLMANWAGGSVINIDKAVSGTGVVSSVSLLAQTDLVEKKQNASIVSSIVENDNQKIKIQIAAPEKGYLLNQIGLFASLDGGEPILLALFQNETGIPMPSSSESPDFLYTFYGILKVSNQGEFSCTVDSEAYVSPSTLEEYVKAHADPIGAAAAVQKNLASHNTNPEAHADIRAALQEMADKGTAATDSTFSSVKAVPETSAPYAEVKEIGGMTRKCRNLIPTRASSTVSGVTATVSNDGTITFDGTTTAGYNYYLYNGKISAGTYYINWNGVVSSANLYVFDSIDNRVIADGSQLFTVATEREVAVYVTCALVGKTLSGSVRPMLNEGDTALPYEPYFEGLRSAPTEKVESIGRNLFGGDAFADKLVEVADATKDEATGTVQFTHKKVSNQLLFTNFKENTQYTFIVYGRNSENEHYTNLVVTYTDDTKTSLTFNATEDVSYAILTTNAKKSVKGLSGSWQSGNTILYYDKCGIFEGVLTEEDFIPYVRNTLPVPDAIQNLDGYGWGYSATVRNYIDFKKKQFVKMFERVDMGTLDWGLKEGATSVFFSWNIRNIVKEYGALLCSKYDVGTSTEVYEKMTMDKAVCVGSPSYIGVADSAYTDAATFKTAMSGVMLYYELAEPIITDISDLLPDGAIAVEEGGTITMVNEFGYDVPNTIDFYLGKNEVIAADTFAGDLVGTASRAVCDKDGNPISSSYAKYADANGSLKANASGQSPSESVVRNSTLVAAETNPTVNGEICWIYE